MKYVTVSVLKLRQAVTENREQHREIFLEALAGYRVAMLKLLDKSIEQLKNGKLLNNAVYLPVPTDHTKDYDRILKMLDLHVNAEVDISQEDFAKYVMDDWAWRREFLGTTSAYSDKAKAILDDDQA